MVSGAQGDRGHVLTRRWPSGPQGGRGLRCAIPVDSTATRNSRLTEVIPLATYADTIVALGSGSVGQGVGASIAMRSPCMSARCRSTTNCSSLIAVAARRDLTTRCASASDQPICN